MLLDFVETGSFSRRGASPSNPDSIRVVSWNVARGARLDEITEFLAGMNADIICLQEADYNARRTGRRHVAAEIACRLEMDYAFGIEFVELAESSRRSLAYHGQATLSRWPLSQSVVLRFRSQSNFWQPHWWIPRLTVFQRRLGGRMALRTQVRVDGRTLVIYNLHLESRGNLLCHEQLSELLNDTCRYDREVPILIAGDFNCNVTEDPAASRLRQFHFQNPFHNQSTPTAQSRSGRSLTIDSILPRGPIEASNPQIHSSVSASDHFPMSLTLPFQ